MLMTEEETASVNKMLDEILLPFPRPVDEESLPELHASVRRRLPLVAPRLVCTGVIRDEASRVAGGYGVGFFFDALDFVEVTLNLSGPPRESDEPPSGTP